MARALGRRMTLVATSSAGRTLAFGQLMARPWRIPPAMVEDMLRGMAEAPGFEATRRAVADYRMNGFEPDVTVTIAWARRDVMTPPHQARRAQRALPRARHVSLPGCGHSPMAEDPESVARLVSSPPPPDTPLRVALELSRFEAPRRSRSQPPPPPP